MGQLLPWGVLILIPVVVFLRARQHVWQEREHRILQKKYGDLPMFADFFQRIESERRQRKERIQ